MSSPGQKLTGIFRGYWFFLSGKRVLGWGAGEGAKLLPRSGLSRGVAGEAVSLPASGLGAAQGCDVGGGFEPAALGIVAKVAQVEIGEVHLGLAVRVAA